LELPYEEEFISFVEDVHNQDNIYFVSYDQDRTVKFYKIHQHPFVETEARREVVDRIEIIEHIKDGEYRVPPDVLNMGFSRTWNKYHHHMVQSTHSITHYRQLRADNQETEKYNQYAFSPASPVKSIM
jgi:hypothetical protein